MAGVRGRCKVCDHKKVALINSKLRSEDTIASIEKLFNISRKTITRHRDKCLASLLSEDKETKEAIVGDVLLKQVNSQIELVSKMIQACDEWLTDPDDPSKYFIGARGDEIDVSFQKVDVDSGRLLPGKEKATLQELIQAIKAPGVYHLLNITNKHADPRDLLLKAITKLEHTVKMINDSTIKLIEWEHKKNALDKLSKEGGVISVEHQVSQITQRVTVALQGSNPIELSKLAELPELNS